MKGNGVISFRYISSGKLRIRRETRKEKVDDGEFAPCSRKFLMINIVINGERREGMEGGSG